MNWFEYYNKNIFINDLLLRNPFEISDRDVKSLLNLDCYVSVSFSKANDVNFMNLGLLGLLSDLGSGSKVKLERRKAVGGRKVNFLALKMLGNKVNYFLDFFLHMVIKGLKRRYINLRVSKTNTGLLNLRFSHISELELDDYFFFELYEWAGSLNIYLTLLNVKKVSLNNLFNKMFISVFNLNNLVKK